MATILIVDDDPAHLKLARSLVETLSDMQVICAENAEEALAKIPREPPDLMLTDIFMPGMNGLELVEKIHEDCPGLPVVLMTSMGTEQLAVRALQAGAASYVPKSDLLDNLVRTIEQVLAVVHAKHQEERIFEYLGSSESCFEMENEPDLVPPLVGFFQENLQRLGYGNDSVRTHVGVALMEAVTNAMLHGNLEVSSELRKKDESEYRKLADARRRQQPYSARRVHVTARESRERITYVVRDEGPGFDPSTLPDPTLPENMLHVSGRGVLLIRTFMDNVEYNENGNQITMSKSFVPGRQPGGRGAAAGGP